MPLCWRLPYIQNWYLLQRGLNRMLGYIICFLFRFHRYHKYIFSPIVHTRSVNRRAIITFVKVPHMRTTYTCIFNALFRISFPSGPFSRLRWYLHYLLLFSASLVEWYLLSSIQCIRAAAGFDFCGCSSRSSSSSSSSQINWLKIRSDAHKLIFPV